MEKIFEKISNYDIFNNLIPGAMFLYTLDLYLKITLYNNNMLYNIVLMYLVGLIINRIGSLFIANILYKFTKVKGESYSEYIIACKNDPKIDVLIKDRNMYRNICSSFVLILVLKIIILLNNYLKINNYLIYFGLLLILIVLFAMSFLKQNKIIVQRIKINGKSIKKENKV